MHSTQSANRVKAFTLIELLVVITIIVILVALLTPALDKAVYEAELAVCASQLNTIATGSIVYAALYMRSYPYRYYRTGGDGRANAISYPVWGDDRTLFESFVPLQAFIDPMVEQVRIDHGSAGPDTYIYISRTVWAGWGYRGHKGMHRIGDRMEHPDMVDPTKTNRFSVLAADLDLLRDDFGEVHAAHPDLDGLLWMWVQRPSDLPALPHSSALWANQSGTRGDFEAQNYAFDDASVERLRNVTPSHGQNAPGDERLRGVDMLHTGTVAPSGYKFFIPPSP